ncbi:DUF1697 domain-containing protein [Candidatus Saccharibacteria bacterium]|nr:MAG: DUF1697 domain-containing protein [Candidatus Saccharibacteria bacterium]
MIYCALLRGINVGGKAIIRMAELKVCFEKLGYSEVKTYINSGNVIFSAPQTKTEALAAELETAIESTFSLAVRVLVKTTEQLQAIEAAVPKAWDDPAIRCYILFLWPSIDAESTLENIPLNSAVETAKYVPGAVIHQYDKKNATKSRLNRLNGTPLYQDITIRNLNTVHKLISLSEQQ